MEAARIGMVGVRCVESVTPEGLQKRIGAALDELNNEATEIGNVMSLVDVQYRTVAIVDEPVQHNVLFVYRWEYGPDPDDQEEWQ